MNIDKIEQFLFDIMGLLVPGFLFLLVPLIIIVIGYDYSSLSIIASVGNIEQLLKYTSLKNNYFYTFLVIAILSYLFGHIVKVFSICFYEKKKKVFDYNINVGIKNLITFIKNFNKDTHKTNKTRILYNKTTKYIQNIIIVAISLIVSVLNFLYSLLKILKIKFIKEIFNNNALNKDTVTKNFMNKYKIKIKKINKLIFYIICLLISIIIGVWKGLCNLFDNLVVKLFKFQTKNYDDSSKEYREKLVKYLKENDVIPDTNLDKYNYPIYKLSCIIQDNTDIKTLVHVFLAKYNFYRSLSFIAFLNIIFIIYLLIFKHVTHATAITYILYLMLLFYLTFHYKYKRYWMLSGNEAIMGLYYYYFLRNS